MNIEGEVEGNAKTKIFSLFMDWIGDGMSQTRKYMHVGHPSMCITCLSVDCERRG